MVHDVVLVNHQLKVKETAETTGNSEERVCHILHKILGTEKLSAQWVPRLLHPKKRKWVTVSEECLAGTQRNSSDAWCQSNGLFRANRLGNSEVSRSFNQPERSWRPFLLVFPMCNRHRLCRRERPSWGNTTLTYDRLFPRFDTVLNEKRPRLQWQKVLLHHDNALAHSFYIVVSKWTN